MPPQLATARSAAAPEPSTKKLEFDLSGAVVLRISLSGGRAQVALMVEILHVAGITRIILKR